MSEPPGHRRGGASAARPSRVATEWRRLVIVLSLVGAVFLLQALREPGGGEPPPASAPPAEAELPRPGDRLVTTDSGVACRSREAYGRAMEALRAGDAPALSQLVEEQRECALPEPGLEASVLEVDPEARWLKVRLRDGESAIAAYMNPPGLERAPD